MSERVGRPEVIGWMRRLRLPHHTNHAPSSVRLSATPGLLHLRSAMAGGDGNDLYANCVVLMVEAAWGKVRTQEDYEDTEPVAALDRRMAAEHSP